MVFVLVRHDHRPVRIFVNIQSHVCKFLYKIQRKIDGIIFHFYNFIVSGLRPVSGTKLACSRRYTKRLIR